MDQVFQLILVRLMGISFLLFWLTKVSKNARALFGEWEKWQILLAPKHNSKKPR
jgi:hypothetical protein